MARSPAVSRVSQKGTGRLMLRLSLIFVGVALFATEIAAQSFSCPIGRNPSCLGYGDKVVSGDAQCFDSFACDFSGFICKSKFNEAVNEYEELRKKFNTLVEVANSCSADLSAISASLGSEQQRAAGLQDDIDRLKRCVQNATSIEDAQSCR